jgi:hypothetical protein
MASTQVNPQEIPWELLPMNFRRGFLEIEFSIYSKVVMRKHNTPLPTIALEEFSDEQLEAVVNLYRDLAHLPPA